MIRNFLETLFASLVGIGLVYAPAMRVKNGQWKPVTAIVIEVSTIALGVAASEIVFGLCPGLHEGWRGHLTRVVTMLVIYLPGGYAASRIRSGRGMKFNEAVSEDGRGTSPGR